MYSGSPPPCDWPLSRQAGDVFGPIAGRTRLVDDQHVAVFGYRVHGDGTDTCAGINIEDTPITTIRLETVHKRRSWIVC